jgi:rod shape-determining protein MreC
VTVRRLPSSPLSPRGAGALRRRLAVGSLVLLSLVLITVTFRADESGRLTGVHSAGSAVLRPFAVGFERIAQPFRDAYSWGDSLLDARARAERLEQEVRELRQRVIQNEFARQQAESLQRLLDYVESPRFPGSYVPVAAEVIGKPPNAFTRAIVIAAGTEHGVRVDDAVVTGDGLVGLVTRVSSGTARVQLLTDPDAAVSAIDLRTGARGIVLHARGTRETLVLDFVRKQDEIKRGHEIVTAGWRTGDLSSLYPKGIPIGEVTSVGVTDTDLFQQVQVEPYVDFGALDAVIVLLPEERPE